MFCYYLTVVISVIGIRCLESFEKKEKIVLKDHSVYNHIEYKNTCSKIESKQAIHEEHISKLIVLNE